jgi:hypothetical protein
MRHAIIWDTSVLNVYLQIPGKETCGPTNDAWDKARIDELVRRREADGTLFVLPVAAILECGNHIAQATGDRFQLAQRLAQLILDVAEGRTPWAAIADYEQVWNSDALQQLARDWPKQAAQKISLADLTIQRVADNYARAAFSVEILTGDRGLLALQPPPPSAHWDRPRRRS